MLVTADKFYGVLFNNQKVSSIRAIKREEAQEFVDQVRFQNLYQSIEFTDDNSGGTSAIVVAPVVKFLDSVCSDCCV